MTLFVYQSYIYVCIFTNHFRQTIWVLCRCSQRMPNLSHLLPCRLRRRWGRNVQMELHLSKWYHLWSGKYTRKSVQKDLFFYLGIKWIGWKLYLQWGFMIAKLTGRNFWVGLSWFHHLKGTQIAITFYTIQKWMSVVLGRLRDIRFFL